MERFETKAFSDYKYAKLIYNLDICSLAQLNKFGISLCLYFTLQLG